VRPTTRLFVAATALGLATFLFTASAPVEAHTPVTVGEYQLLVGWREEPPISGSLNGLDLRILNGTSAPVLNAEQTLTAVLASGTASVSKDLSPQFGRPGWYTFDVIPTRPGNYSVRLQGTLGNTSVGVTSVDVRVFLQDVSPASDLAFPDPDLQARLDTLQLLLVLALVVAIVGLAIGAVGLSRLPKRARAPETPP
jgi:hypothetical protein